MSPFEELPVAPLSAEEKLTSGGVDILDSALSLLEALGFVQREVQQTGCLGR